MKFNDFIDMMLGRDDPPEEPEQDKIEKYISNLDIETGVAKLSGPFLSECYALAHYETFKDVLRHTYSRVNLTITRCFTLLCEDGTFTTRDDPRIELGIDPFKHIIELSIVKQNDGIYFDVKGVDGLILMNENDCASIRGLVEKFPPTAQELRVLMLNN